MQCDYHDKHPFIGINPLQAAYAVHALPLVMLQGGAELGLRPRRRVEVQEGARRHSAPLGKSQGITGSDYMSVRQNQAPLGVHHKASGVI